MLTSASLSAMMAQSGPVVTAVLLSVDGTASQASLDMTPSKNSLALLLGGVAGILGQLPSLKAVGVARRDGILDEDEQDAAPSKLDASIKQTKAAAAQSKVLARLTGKKLTAPTVPRNVHVLPAPLTDVKVNGPIVFVRMSDESEPLDLSLDEYKAYVANPVLLSSDDEPSEAEASGASGDEDEEEEEEEEEEDEEEEEEEEEEDSAEDDDDNEDDDGEGSDGETEFALVGLVAEFKRTHKGKEPSAEQLLELITEHFGADAVCGGDDEEAVIDGASDESSGEEEEEEAQAKPTGSAAAKSKPATPKSAGSLGKKGAAASKPVVPAATKGGAAKSSPAGTKGNSAAAPLSGAAAAAAAGAGAGDSAASNKRPRPMSFADRKKAAKAAHLAKQEALAAAAAKGSKKQRK